MKPTASQHGIVDPAAAARHFRLTRHAPTPALAPWVERHWVVRWDLQGRAPFVQDVLAHPSVNLVIENGEARVYGVASGRTSHRLEGRGHVVGTKFRPGGFFPFLRRPVAALTDTSRTLGELFGPEGDALAAAVVVLEEPSEQVAAVERFLLARAPALDDDVVLVGRIASLLLSDRELLRVDDLCEHVGLSMRALQRLFHRCVGISPKWMLRRYRLHEAAERLAEGRAVPGAELAQVLGYADQAHFIRDFKALVGTTPAEYAARCEANARALLEG